jgi:metallo-beta-lactamase family protein
MKLTFYGAARQVTGSMYLLETADNYKILIDCGADMERPKRINGEIPPPPPVPLYTSIFPFEASEINLVVLTHAHIDHTGMLPLLLKEGYEGQIICTTPTYHLTNILLHDSAQLNAKRLKRTLDKNRNSRKMPEKTVSLFFDKHVNDTMEQFVTIPINQKFKINDQVSVFFNNAGHLLGAANLVFKVKENGEEKSVCFSGDIGRYNYPLLADPQNPPQVDYMVCESTYGNRLHKGLESPEEALYRVIKKTCVEKKGKLIIPAFSVGRSQALLYTLNKIYQNTDLPKFKVYSDSPMARDSSRVYENFATLLNPEAREFYADNDELFDFENFQYIQDLKYSKALSTNYDPCIIVSSSGMISGGRIEEHVKQNLQNPKSTICIIGYSAEGTIGYELMNGAKEVKIKNKTLEVRADIEVLDCFSAHGDLNDLLKFVKSQDTQKLKSIFLTHGNEEGMTHFKSKLNEEGYQSVVMPSKGEEFQL